MDSYAKVMKWLEKRLAEKNYQNLLISLKYSNPIFRQFRVWSDVVEFINSRAVMPHEKDSVLRTIYARRRKGNDPRWLSILLFIFQGLVRSFP